MLRWPRHGGNGTAINIAHRQDLDERVERLAAALDLRGRGRKTAVIERALDALEAHVERTRPRRADVLASIGRYVEAGRRLRARPDTGRPSSLTLQDALYDDRGLPR